MKTGQESASHVVQVMIYLYAIPRAFEQYRTLKLRGQATYPDHTVRIPAEAVDDQFIESLEVWPESHWPGFALRQADVLQS